jgi:hypothetical protein
MSMTFVHDGVDDRADSMTMMRGLDRRRAVRVQQQRPVKVYEPFVSRFFSGRMCDVSSTGMCLEFASWVTLRPGRVIHVHVGVATEGQPLPNRRNMIPARVVWQTSEKALNNTSLHISDHSLESSSNYSLNYASEYPPRTKKADSDLSCGIMKVGVEFLTGIKASAA